MSLKLIIFILSILNYPSVFCHKCGADLLIKKFGVKPNRTSEGVKKRNLDTDYTPINIKIDYTVLDIQKRQNLINDNNYKTFKDELENIAEYFKKIVSVQYERFDNGSLLEKIKNHCYSSITSIGDVGSYDLIVYPQVDTEEEYVSNGVIAAASHCLLSETERPIVGIVLLNKELNSKIDLMHYIRNTLFHEFFHILGFNHIFFTQTLTKNSYTYLNSPKLLEKAKIHFGCDNIEGIRMEDQGESGTVGSHWDARYMQGELMIAEDYSEVVLSEMTLAFLEDLGYYKVNYYTGGLFRFGKNQGCAFLQKKCVYSEGALFPNEFCSEPNAPICTGSHTSKGICYLIRYRNNLPENYRYFTDPNYGGKIMADYCPISFISEFDNDYNYPTNCVYGKKENSDEIIGNNSMCFESSINLSSKKSICYQMECDRVNKQIKVKIGQKTIICNGEKNDMENPEGLTGNLSCPDYNMICTSDIWCNNMFDCINKESTPDESTYYYISNRGELEERDNYFLNLDDSLKYNLVNSNGNNGNNGNNDNNDNNDYNDSNGYNFCFQRYIWQNLLFILF